MELKKFIKLKGWTLQKLSHHCGINPSVLSFHLHGHRALPEKHLQKLSTTLDVSSQEIVKNKIVNVETKLKWYKK